MQLRNWAEAPMFAQGFVVYASRRASQSPSGLKLSPAARMLRTALGPAISAYLEDPGIVEVMLNPDGRLWIDRLSGEAG